MASRVFCAECGQRQPMPQDHSMHRMLLDAFHELTSLDGRLIRSVIALMTRPGLLTKEWSVGRRGRYVKPMSLFVMLNVAFFILQPHTGLLGFRYQQYVSGQSAAARRHVVLIEARRAKIGVTPAQFETRFNDVLKDQKKSMLIVCIPALALALGLLYLGQGYYVAEHFVFSVHIFSFLIVLLALYAALLLALVGGLRAFSVPLTGLAWLDGDFGIKLILVAGMGTYTYLAIRRVYADRPLAAVLRAAVVFLVIERLTDLYYNVLFYTTLFTV